MITAGEFSLLQDVFRSIVEKELGHLIPLPPEAQEAAGRRDPASSERLCSEACAQWLGLLDLAISPHKLRGYVSAQDPEELTLVALIRFLVLKKAHSEADRDKVDWLLTHLFKKREERTKLLTGWPKQEIQNILAGAEFPPLGPQTQDQLSDVPALLDEIKYFTSFHQITDSRAVERGRSMKNQFGEEFFHPDVLAAIVNYNLLLGKKFHTLIQEVSSKIHEFAQAEPGRTPPDTKVLLQDDYRSSAGAFRDLGDLDRKEPAPDAAPPAAAAPPASPQTSIERQLRHLGVDPAPEALHLSNRIQELSMRFRSNLQTVTVPNSVSPVRLQEWEAGAFRSKYAETEQTFRAEFARDVCQAIGIVSRIYEEIPLYFEKKGTEFFWKKHHDALVFLLYEGRKHKEALLKLSAVSQQRGLREKAQQLQVTAEKLDQAVEKAAEVF